MNDQCLTTWGQTRTFDPSHPPLVNHTPNTFELALIPACSRQNGRRRKTLGSVCVGELPLPTQSLRWKFLTKAQRKFGDNLRYTR
ncbi:hypothetical protein [Planctopirus hydrillae]|uniref:hypothetical protein n=1 Tax=Planctopirus hydrillae TaxID=1841610 RepID=UPI0013F4DEE3|nr:hypothetical protein [Planctopirus hydrillae]